MVRTMPDMKFLFDLMIASVLTFIIWAFDSIYTNLYIILDSNWMIESQEWMKWSTTAIILIISCIKLFKTLKNKEK